MIHVDHYQSRPIAPFDDLKSSVSGKSISKVPVIRIFGADSRGHKICLHVHGFYPYVAIQNTEPNNKDLARKIVLEVERAIEENVKENRRKLEANQADTRDSRDQAARLHVDLSDPLTEEAEANLNARIVNERRLITNLSADQKSPIHRIETMDSFNYYGYHNKKEPFFKLYLYNPRIVKQLALVFEDCKVLGRFIPVFWAHLPYILLFFIDNNLRGMQFIDLDQIYWRKGRAPSWSQTVQSSNQDSQPIHDSNSPDDFEDDQNVTDIEPISTCELEADVRFEWIANRKQFGANGNDDALRELWLDDQETSQATSLSEQKLPLYDLERHYVQQLCEAYGVDLSSGELVITDRPRPVKPEISDDSFSDDFDDYQEDSGEGKDEDLFSDDDEFLLKAISQTQPLDRESTTKPAGNKRRTSDNSIIDGRSIVCSSAGQNRSRSQRSSSSTRETVNHEYQYFCLMTMELHATNRNKLRPDPALDPIEAIFYCIRNDVPEESDKSPEVVGVIMTDPFKQLPDQQQAGSANAPKSPGTRSNLSYALKMRALLHKTGLSVKNIEFNIVDTELELIMSLIEVVKTYDPELLIGYEMEQFSWGYVLERSTVLNINISAALGRIIDGELGHNSKYVESNFVQPIMFSGRMVFSTWRIIRHDIHLNTCSYERIHEFALGERVPCFDFDTLTKWFNEHRNRWRVIDYYLIRVLGQMRILDRFDLIAKVSELARVYGTQFIDVMTRGSQIGIESMMLRLAKLQNLTPLSPTVMQRNKMKAPEALPLVMEPETNIYYDPVAVLDFQSLYPSVVIAYNYCYSTCLGRVTDLESKERHNFGCSQLHVEEEEIRRLLRTNSVHVSPCGVAYVKKNIRHGILPKMLNELIVTRAMVKDQMKSNMRSHRPNRRLQRILDHRQHGLKMMANTTYGYAGASYTGRMPCVEIADSIVSKGRETLENAIELVESKAEWNAKVIYGDTDSIFIQFKNCDKSTAFTRAYEMVEAISAANPHPIKMKFEKIYQPCVLQTKKRYCGFKFESPEQTRPEFEAKGIETVRRDCCPAAARMLEMALRIQFTTRNIQEVKKYVQHQFLKIMSGKLSNIQDFIFARQYKPRDISKNESVFVPAWQITKRLIAIDPRSEPRIGERVPFVIIYGEPRTPLVNLAKTPMEVLSNPSYRINGDYYIQKIICPTLNRIFCTMKIDTLVWYKSMTHRNIIHRSHYLVAQKNQLSGSKARPTTMSQYFSPSHCPVCAKSVPLNEDICDSCGSNLQSSVIRLTEEISKNQRKLFAHHQICKACSSLERDEEDEIDNHINPCISYDCQNLFRYHQAKLDALNSNYLTQVLKNLG